MKVIADMGDGLAEVCFAARQHLQFTGVAVWHSDLWRQLFLLPNAGCICSSNVANHRAILQFAPASLPLVNPIGRRLLSRK